MALVSLCLPGEQNLYSQKNFTSLSARCWAGNPRIVKARSSHGSAVNMNEQAHDNMSAPPRQNDGDDGYSKMYCYSLRFLFYNPLIINSVYYAYFCRCFYRNSAMTCERTSVFLTIYFNKNLYTARKGFYSSTVLQSENERLL